MEAENDNVERFLNYIYYVFSVKIKEVVLHKGTQAPSSFLHSILLTYTTYICCMILSSFNGNIKTQKQFLKFFPPVYKAEKPTIAWQGILNCIRINQKV